MRSEGRDQAAIERSVSRQGCYDSRDTIKIDTVDTFAKEVAARIPRETI